MLDPKLPVVRRKIMEYVRQRVNLLDVKRIEVKAVPKQTVLSVQRQPLHWKLGPSTAFIRNQQKKPQGNVFSTIFRCLNFSVSAIISPYPKVTKMWKIIVPAMLKDDFLTIWIRTPKKVTAPPHTRGLIGKPSERRRPVRPFVKHSPLKEANLEEWTAPAEETKMKPPPEETKMKPPPEETKMKPPPEEPLNLPPPQRCRLSCPLPPAEFIPSEEAVPLPGCPSPTGRAQPYHPEAKQVQKDVGKEEPKGENPKFRLPSASYVPQTSVKNVKIKKDYLNPKSYKSNEYSPQVEISPKMNALMFEPVSLSLNYNLVNAPSKIYKDEVLVQVAYSGITCNDVFITEGIVPAGDSPVILGHEISGRVYAVGSEVHHVSKGDDVAINPFSACCVCRYCTRGLFSSCVNEGLHNSIGVLKHGGWAQFVVVKKSQVHKIPSELGLDQAALVQPLSCVLSALSKLNIMYGMSVFIQGLGLSGCLWASVLHSRGHKNVFVTDKSDKRKAQFEILGLDYRIVPPEEINKQSADVIIECSGSPVYMEKSFNIINSNGKLCFFGKPNPLTEIRCLPYDIIRKEVTLVGNSGNAFFFTEAIDAAVSMSYRYLDFEKLGVQTFELKDYKEAFQLKKSGDATKIVFKLT